MRHLAWHHNRLLLKNIIEKLLVGNIATPLDVAQPFHRCAPDANGVSSALLIGAWPRRLDAVGCVTTANRLGCKPLKEEAHAMVSAPMAGISIQSPSLTSAGSTTSGTWTADGAQGFVSYGPAGPAFPPGSTGGEARLKVALDTGATGVLTIICVLGTPPAGKSEGVTLVLGNGVSGEFTQSTEGNNVFILS